MVAAFQLQFVSSFFPEKSLMIHRVAATSLSILVALVAQLRAAEPNQLSDDEKSAGWKLLFDGKSADGWRGYKQPEPPEKWVVEDGALKGKGGGDLITEGQYDNYELSLEWMLPKGGNSGIIYRCAETDGPSYITGPEIQVLDNMDTNSKNSAGSCYDLYPPTKDVLKPNGEWNSVKLVIKPDNHVEHWMNGEKICEYQIGSDDWNERIAKSKWAGAKEFGKVTKGHIALQDHGNEVWYRNIKIRELK
jgi:hypothetical protein